MSGVILVLSEHAGRELQGYLNRGGQPADAFAGHPPVIDDIQAELASQLPDSTAVAIAERVAQAGASALQPKGT